MQIDVAPETARLVREEISTGKFHSADEVIRAGVEALREKVLATKTPKPAAQASNLYELFAPVRGLLTDEEIDRLFARDPWPDRPVDLS